MIVLLGILLGLAVVFCASQAWLVVLLVRRNKDLVQDVRYRNEQIHVSWEVVASLCDIIEEKDNLLDAAHANIELLCENDSQQVKNLTAALEMVLSDRGAFRSS